MIKPQPFCRPCWVELIRGEPTVDTKMDNPTQEICCMCGNQTKSGLYLRVSSTTVRYLT